MPLRNLTEHQRNSIDKLCDEIKWLLEDEICATLLNSPEPISNDTIEYVVHHVIDGHASRVSCKMEKIVLNFVFITEPSHEKFLEEFQGLSLPFGYKLCKGELFYYVAKDPILQESQTYVNLSNIAGRSSGNSEFPLDIHDVFRETQSNLESSCREDTMSQQSDITSGSVSGTDGGKHFFL